MFLKGTATLGFGLFLPSFDSVAGPPCDLEQISSSTLDALANGLSSKSHLILPTNSQYTNSRKIWNARYERYPTAIVKAHNSDEIGFTVGWCKDNGITPRIRCGGHSFAGYSTGGTIVIDVGEMNQINVDGNGQAEIYAGANLGTVYAALRCPHGLSMPAGTCKFVGVSGLTMAGGMGLLMREDGLTIDKLVEAEIVLADGKVHRASESENPLLFWALRGGGSGSYGVVTSWRFNTVPSVQRVVCNGRWHWDSFVQVFTAWEQWLQQLPPTCYAGLSITANANTEPFFAVTMYGNEGTGTELVGYMHDLQSMSVPTTNIPRANDYNFPPCTPPEGEQETFGFHKSRMTNTPIGEAGATVLKEAFDSRANDPVLYGTTAFCLNDGLGGAIAQKAPEDTAWVHRHAMYCSQMGAMYNNMPQSTDARDACQKWIRSMYASLESHYDAGCYQGYWDRDIENWQEMYYGTNYHKLQVAKSEYDSGDFFKFQRSIEPL